MKMIPAWTNTFPNQIAKNPLFLDFRFADPFGNATFPRIGKPVRNACSWINEDIVRIALRQTVRINGVTPFHEVREDIF